MNEQRDEREKRVRLNLTTSQVAASALAACCASIVASYLGVAGTVIGAAVGSVVATIGAAVYGHLFRRGSARLRATLQVNGRVTDGAGIPEGAAGAAGGEAQPGSRAVPAARSRFYGAAQTEARAGSGTGDGTGHDETRAKLWLPASSTAQLPTATRTARMPQTPPAAGEPTVLVGGHGASAAQGTPRALGALGTPGTDVEVAGASAGDAAGSGSGSASGGGRLGSVTAMRRYGRPIGVAAAIVAVFCVAITVGFLLGGPVRSAGASSAPPASTATHRQDTQGQDGGGAGPTQATDPSSSPSATPSGSASSTGPTSGPTTTSSAGTPSTSPSATAGATGTGGASSPAAPPHAGATAAGSNGP